MSSEQQQPKKKKERTIQVKIGNQAARAMTPDQAADYLKSIAGKGWGSGRELKMTFDNGSTSTVSLPRTSGTRGGGGGIDDGGSSGFPNTSTGSRSTTTRADGMPCSEKEMKALMSMFVEIMGLQMNTDRLNASVKSTTTKQKKFTFPADLPPPPGGWPEDLMWPSREEDDENSSGVDSLPELEAIPESERAEMLKLQRENAKKFPKKKGVRHPQPIPPVPGTTVKETENGTDDQTVTGSAGIVPFEWSALERAAIEDALEQEERIRKDSASAAKKKKKKSVSSAEAAVALQKVEAANKKLDKAVAAWRSRVVSATAGNETSLLKDLLAESPLAALQSTTKNAHLEFLVAHTVPKNWKFSISSAAEARMLLAKYIVTDFSPVYMFAASCRNGRSAAHTACFYADVPMVRMIVDVSAKKLGGGQLTEKLQLPCQDSGWTVLQYAVVSGSMRTVEAVFAGCPDYNIPAKLCQAVTNDTHTWKKGTSRGVTARQLAEALLSGKHDKMIETHGMALQEVLAHHKLKNSNTTTTTTTHSLYLAELGRIAERLKEIEASGYTPMNEKEIGRMEKEIAKELEEKQRKQRAASVSSSVPPPRAPEFQRQGSVESEDELVKAASNNNNGKKSKKKKKKKKGSSSTASSSTDSKPPPAAAPDVSHPQSVSRKSSQHQDDPLVAALKGMGFEEDQIMAGVKACGGISRATADDVVAWIFGGGEPASSAAPSEDGSETKEKEDSKVPAISKEEAERLDREAANQKEQERIVAEQLAAKREEQRRRNREWNNRAQARQRQEAQEKLVKAAELKAGRSLRTTTGLAPASNFLSANSASGVMPLQGPSLTVGVQQPQQSTGGGLKLGLDATARKQTPNSGATRQVSRLHLSDSGVENAYSNDASTVASSVDHGSIEVGGNDDATVSTMGSFPAVPPPVQSAYAPPGFPDGQANREVSASHPHWEAQRSLSMGDVYGGSYAPGGSGGGGGMGPPPGIPESGPLLDHHGGYHAPAMRSHSFNIPSHQASRHPTAGQAPFPTGPAVAAPGGTPNLLTGPGFSSQADKQQPSGGGGGGMGPSLLSGSFAHPPPRSGTLERASTVPGNSSSSMTNDPVIPGLLGFGSDLKHQIPQASTLDSSIIDSISTGNTAIGGSALWGDSAAPSGGGSSLLGNLINNSSEFQLPEASNQNAAGGGSLFSSSSFNSSNKQINNAPGTKWVQDRTKSMDSSGGGSGSIW